MHLLLLGIGYHRQAGRQVGCRHLHLWAYLQQPHTGTQPKTQSPPPNSPVAYHTPLYVHTTQHTLRSRHPVAHSATTRTSTTTRASMNTTPQTAAHLSNCRQLHALLAFLCCLNRQCVGWSRRCRYCRLFLCCLNLVQRQRPHLFKLRRNKTGWMEEWGFRGSWTPKPGIWQGGAWSWPPKPWSHSSKK